MTERRYSEEEVAQIIQRAAENQQSTKHQFAMAEGLTLAELQEIGLDVGISPELVRVAAKYLDATGRRDSRRWFGLPIGVSRTIELDRRLSQSEWERLVIDLRETFDAPGTVRSDGNFKQWTNGNLQALVEPVGTGDRVRLRTVKDDAQRDSRRDGAARRIRRLGIYLFPNRECANGHAGEPRRSSIGWSGDALHPCLRPSIVGS